MNKTSLVQCEEQVQERGGFAFRRKRLAAAAGGKGLGLSWFELPPGKKAFPMHFHLANDEAVFIRFMHRPQGDAAVATRTIERAVDLVAGWPDLNEFKHTSISR